MSTGVLSWNSIATQLQSEPGTIHQMQICFVLELRPFMIHLPRFFQIFYNRPESSNNVQPGEHSPYLIINKRLTISPTVQNSELCALFETTFSVHRCVMRISNSLGDLGRKTISINLPQDAASFRLVHPAFLCPVRRDFLLIAQKILYNKRANFYFG
jgi:hypothetical protein